MDHSAHTVPVSAPAFTLRFLSTYFILVGLVFSGMIFFEVDSSSGLHYLLPPVFAAWLGFCFAPVRWKPVFYFLPFALLLFYAFGLICALVYLGLAGFFIVWPHLPIPKWLRYVLLAIVMALLLLERLGYFGLHRLALVIPYLAAAFMFRWLIYLQEIKYKKVNEPWWMRVAYFLQPANLIFLLYPIVDYRKFVQSYHLTEYHQTIRVAVERLYRSLFHYLLYRLLYFYVVPPYTEVQDAPSLFLFAISGYMLILHISSIFYGCVGIMGLFGFNLPDPFNFYFLPTGFTQLWTRINIYWREFIVRIFYYPFYFKVRKVFPAQAIWLGTIWCFVTTWIMHFYQTFWLTGRYQPSAVDIIYWGAIGFGVTLTTYLVQAKKINVFRLTQHLYYSAAVLLTIRILFMFLFMSFLWVLWKCENITEWFSLLQKLAVFNGSQALLMAAILATVLFIGPLIWLWYEKGGKKYFTGVRNSLAWTIPFILLCLSLVLAEKAGITQGKHFTEAFGHGLNQADKQNNEQGYYDQIIAGNASHRLPWEVQLAPPLDWSQGDGGARATNNLLLRELRPSTKLKFHGIEMETNQWAMRDKEYALQKPAHTTRMVLVGGSYEAGSGIKNNEIYESLAETSINEQFGETGNKRKIEILNMALGGYYLAQALWIVEHKVSAFKPDYLVYAAHEGEAERLVANISKLVVYGADLEYDFLLKTKAEANVHQHLSRREVKRRLMPYAQRMLDEGYTALVDACKKQGIQPVWMYVPVLGHDPDVQEVKHLKKLAASKGFIVLDLSGAYGNVAHSKLQVAENDNHPNAEGHRLLGRAMAGQLVEKIVTLGDQ